MSAERMNAQNERSDRVYGGSSGGRLSRGPASNPDGPGERLRGRKEPGGTGEDLRNGRLYIFDMGGVVSLDSGYERKIADHLGIPLRELFALADEDFRVLTAGRISLGEFWRRVSYRTGRPIEEELFETHFRPRLNRRVARLVGSLRRASRVVVGTNTVESHYRIHSEKGHYDLFDEVYASCRMGLVKPDPEFYRYILAREGRRAKDSLFVDDREDNVLAATRLGMTALVFRGAEELERKIEALGRGGDATG
jgi:HAD superfamily hydrolase (TIGR01509 family)